HAPRTSRARPRRRHGVRVSTSHPPSNLFEPGSSRLGRRTWLGCCPYAFEVFYGALPCRWLGELGLHPFGCPRSPTSKRCSRGREAVFYDRPMNQERPVGWIDVWNVVKASAVRRLGKPLLVLYALLAVFGLVVVGSMLVMRFGAWPR